MTDDRKKLGPVLAMMIVATAMIGSGVFLLPASLGAVGSISIFSWVAAMLGAGLIGGVFCWLAVINPGTQGLFSYIRDAFGPCAGFVVGALYWASCLVGMVAVALAVTGYLSVFVPTVAKPPGTTIATIAIIWLLVGANMVGPRFVAWTQSWILPIGLAPVLLVAIGGWFYFHAATFAASWNVTGESFFAVVPRTTVVVFWAFLGFEGAIVISKRVRDPARNVPIATLGGLAVAAVIYIAASAAIMGILPAAALAKSSAPFADAVVPMLGASVAAVVALCAMIKAAGTLGATTLATVETAECESVLGYMRRASPAQSSHRVSTSNLLLTGVLASLVTILSASPTIARQFTVVTNVAVVLSMLAYGAASLALLRLSGALSRGSRMWARALGVAAALFSVVLIAVSEADLLVWTAGAVIVALLAYWSVRLRQAKPLPNPSEA
ncbi:MAG TPA: amino acid permease [Rhizomicrobium sp.]